MKSSCITLMRALPTVLALASLAPAHAQVDPFRLLDDDPRRALIVRVAIDEGDGAQLVERLISDLPPRAHIGNPPQILVERFDVGGLPIGSSFAWDPLRERAEGDDGSEVEVVVAQAIGAFQVPMSGDLGSVRVSRLTEDDDDPGIELITVDVADLVLDFCRDRLDDPNCGESNHPPVADAGGPYQVAAGGSVALDGSGSFDHDDDPLELRWDLDGDLVFGETGEAAGRGDELGTTPLFVADQEVETVNVAIEVCDPTGDCSFDGGSVEVLASEADSDGDGVADELDRCADTAVPEAAPSVTLRPNRFALTGVSGPEIFESSSKLVLTTADTGGCSCEQIVGELDLGRGHLRFGCSRSAMEQWLSAIDPP